MGNECNCLIVSASLILPFLGIGMRIDLFQSCGHWWVFQICWHIECNTLMASSFTVLNSSTGIPSHPLDFLTAGSWASHGKYTGVVCHSLLQRITFCENSPVLPIHLGWHGSWLQWVLQIPLPRQGSDPWRGDYHYRYRFLCICYSGPLILSLPIYCYFFETDWLWLNSQWVFCFKWVPLYISKKFCL